MDEDLFGYLAWITGIGMIASGLGYGGCQTYEALRPEKPPVQQERYLIFDGVPLERPSFPICTFESQEARELAESALRPLELIANLEMLPRMDSDSDTIITESEVINYVRKH